MWAELYPEYCDGTEQSPINIVPDDTTHNDRLDDVDFLEADHREEKRMILYNNGHTGKLQTSINKKI